ncbi:MAG TPA: ArsA-related P-loop ATPase, partial [Anaerovoracaceae bacterium]|nr:ArsA-related P-loop ATPase [Anaerovoracaceae bacterium]
NAEQLPIEETKKAVKMLEKFNIPVETLVINRILPEEIDEEFWLKKKKQEQKYMKDIEKEFSGKTFIKIPLLDSDMNKNTIDRLAEYFIL